MAARMAASGSTGWTLPGMMELPAWRTGSRISPRPLAFPQRFDGALDLDCSKTARAAGKGLRARWKMPRE